MFQVDILTELHSTLWADEILTTLMHCDHMFGEITFQVERLVAKLTREFLVILVNCANVLLEAEFTAEPFTALIAFMRFHR